MKKITSLVTAAVASLSFSLTALAGPILPDITIPQPDVNFGAVIEASIMANLSCSFTASAKFVDTSKNTITYSMNYSNKNESTIKKPYGIQVGTDAELIINARGEATMAKGNGKIVLPSGKTTGSFTVNPKVTSKVTFNGNINGKKCTTKEVTTVKTLPIFNRVDLTPNIDLDISGGVSASGEVNNGGANQENQGNQNPPAAPADTKTCKVIAEGTLKDSSVLMGAAIDYEGYDAKMFPFTLRGHSESKPNDVREYTGSQELKTGHNYVLNSDQRGFLFELPLSENPETYVITATLGGRDCSLVSFAIPSTGARAQAQNGVVAEGGAALGNGVVAANSTVAAFGASPADAQTAAQLDLAETATNEGAQDAQNSTATDVLLVIGGIVLAAAAYGLYRWYGSRNA